jgi:hypothetical protein
MSNIFTFALIFLILVASFTEIIVFNDEVLLSLCFIAFVFFAYSSLNKTFFDIFEDRANKFESDLLLAFKAKSDTSIFYMPELLDVKSLDVKQEVFELLATQYIDVTVEVSDKKLLTDSASLLNAKLVEVPAQEQKRFIQAQASCIQTVLYPTIFSLGKDYMTLLKNVKRTSTKLSNLMIK